MIDFVECPYCKETTLPRIDKRSAAISSVCQNPKCRKVVTREQQEEHLKRSQKKTK